MSIKFISDSHSSTESSDRDKGGEMNISKLWESNILQNHIDVRSMSIQERCWDAAVKVRMHIEGQVNMCLIGHRRSFSDLWRVDATIQLPTPSSRYTTAIMRWARDRFGLSGRIPVFFSKMMFVRSLLPFSLTLSVSMCAGATFTECLDVCRSDFSKFVLCIFHHDIPSMCFDMCWHSSSSPD